MIIKRTGYYREMPHGETGDPSIHEDVGKGSLSRDDLGHALSYLRDAPVLVSCTGYVQDVVDPEKGVAGIPDCKTDGVWAWPGDYPYYIKEYGIPVEEAFLEHMREGGWNPTFDVSAIDFDSLTFVDHDGKAVG